MTRYRVITKDIHADQLLIRKVIKNNNTSGKVSLPKSLIGKKVYVVVPEDEKDE